MRGRSRPSVTDWLIGYRTGSRRHVRFRTLPWTVDLWRGLLIWRFWLRGGGGRGLEQSVPISSSAVRPVDGVTEKVSEWKPVINPVLSYILDSRLMEGTTYLEHPALGVSLDGGLRAGMSSTQPTRQSVLNTLSVIRPDETDRPEHPAMASQMHYEQSCFKSSAWPMPDPDLNYHTDVNEDINTDLPETTAPMMNSQMDHKRSCVNPSARPMLDSDIVIPTDVNV